jgi:hypothetical protein
VSDAQLKHYIAQLLAELADLADGRTNDAELGALAFKLRLLAGLQNRDVVQISPKRQAVH